MPSHYCVKYSGCHQDFLPSISIKMAKKRGPTLVFQLAPRKKRSRQGIKVDINLLGLGLSTTYFFIKFKLKTVEKLNHRPGKRRKSILQGAWLAENIQKNILEISLSHWVYRYVQFVHKLISKTQWNLKIKDCIQILTSTDWILA